jgi:C_GCAxxG_C_C family probable redox protein
MGMGEVCGALIGAFMVLGLSLGHQEDERQTRFRTYDLVREFVERFKSHHGTIYCKELLGGVDLRTKGGIQEAADKKLFTTVAPSLSVTQWTSLMRCCNAKSWIPFW